MQLISKALRITIVALVVVVYLIHSFTYHSAIEITININIIVRWYYISFINKTVFIIITIFTILSGFVLIETVITVIITWHTIIVCKTNNVVITFRTVIIILVVCSRTIFGITKNIIIANKV